MTTADRYGHLFPRFHVRPPRGFVNDPNGPLLLDGLLHLYFQYRTAASGAGPVSWGHATSSDFVSWRHHRPAIAPQPFGPDRDGCWSGTTVVADGRVVALYAGFVAGMQHQPVVRASSPDRGYSFGEGAVVVPGPAPDDGVAHFRDPFVWRDGDRWRMLVGAGGRDQVAAARSFESVDLVDWSPTGALLEMARRRQGRIDTGAMWECPQLATLSGTDVLIVSPWAPDEELKPVVTITDPARPALLGRLDHGSCFYAASVLRDAPDGSLVWGWARETRSDDWCVEDDWSGMLTLPRLLELGADGEVLSRPIPALRLLRGSTLAPERTRGRAARIDGVPAQFEVAVRLAPGDRAAPPRIRLSFSPDEHLECVLDRASGRVVVDTSSASRDVRATGSRIAFADPALRSGEPYTLTAYVDGSIVELFSGGGRCATVRAYPTASPPWTLEVEGLTGQDELAGWELRPSTA